MTQAQAHGLAAVLTCYGTDNTYAVISEDGYCYYVEVWCDGVLIDTVARLEDWLIPGTNIKTGE